jgi:hypothetical protein
MAPTFAMPLMSTIDSSQPTSNHSRMHSHQRSGHRLTRPLALPRIPSERLDPRSVNYDRNSIHHESGQKRGEQGERGEHSVLNRVSFGANASINAPSLHSKRQLNKTSKRATATSNSPEAVGTSPSQADETPRINGRAEISATRMDSQSRLVMCYPQD